MIGPAATPAPIRYADPAAVVARAMAALKVPERLSVSAAAERFMHLANAGGGLSGRFSFDLAPYLRRPMDCLTGDSPFRVVALMGPSQCGKSSVGNAWNFVYTPIVDPANMLTLFPDKDTGRGYILQEANAIIDASPAVRAKLLENNVFDKQFEGCIWWGAWPVGSQLRAKPVPRTRIDDLDGLPDEIRGEGSPLELLSSRSTTFEGFEKVYVNSSPAKGPRRGIEAVVATGTDERWHVRCLHCDEGFALDFDALRFDGAGTPEDARASAAVACPDCGGIHEQKDKAALMARGAWIGPEQRLRPDGTVEGALRRTDVASFRIEGLAGFLSWGRIAQRLRAAEIAFEATQDEAPLRAVWNTVVGRNYTSRLAGADPVAAETLIARAEASTWSRGTVPDGVRVLTAAVDVQGNRFEWAVWGWADGRECWLIARGQIVATQDPATGEQTAIDPRRPEHWGVLIGEVIRRRWPLAADPSRTVPVLNVAIDTGGVEGVTDAAFAFWYHAIGLGVPPTSITLVKGGNNPNARLLPPPTPDVKRRIKGLPQAELFLPNVNRIKDSIDHRLRLGSPGPGHVHFHAGTPDAVLMELTAEVRENGVWERLQGRPNETLDLMVYGEVALIRHVGQNAAIVEELLRQKAGWALVPAVDAPASLARPSSRVPEPANAVRPAPPTEEAAPAPAPSAASPPAARRRGGLRIRVRG